MCVCVDLCVREWFIHIYKYSLLCFLFIYINIICYVFFYNTVHAPLHFYFYKNMGGTGWGTHHFAVQSSWEPGARVGGGYILSFIFYNLIFCCAIQTHLLALVASNTPRTIWCSNAWGDPYLFGYAEISFRGFRTKGQINTHHKHHIFYNSQISQMLVLGS